MKRKVVIIGGGMAALAAAFDLTRTEALRDQFDVTIYQMGWRLGGKAASGRDCEGRVVEHGLHVWFGCYENAFGLVREAYDEWTPLKGQAITTAEDAFQARSHTVIGSGDLPEFFCFDWPPIDGRPGEDGAPPLLWPCIQQLLFVIEKQYQKHGLIQPLRVVIPPDILALLKQADVPLNSPSFSRWQSKSAEPMVEPFIRCLGYTWRWAESLANRPELRDEAQLRGFVRFLRRLSWHLLADEKFRTQPGGEFLAKLLDVGTALVKGVILEMLLGGASVVELDRLDFREWLSTNGADRNSVYGSSLVQSIYDTAFQYTEGDARRPDFGAGTAAQVAMRLFGTYKGAFEYESQSSLGEVVVAPIYRLLVQRNVHFQFFQKLTRLELNADRDAIAVIHFDTQVKLRLGTYDPTIPPRPEFGNLECWPEQPLWEQIEDGEALSGLDLESYWCAQKYAEATLRQGVDFDEAVLAIPVGAFKPLNNAPGPCAELIAASDRFRKMTDAASLVPSISVQAWCASSLAELGWPPPDLPLGSKGEADVPLATGPRPLSIWADRTPVMKYENWRYAEIAPASLQYLCDVLDTDLYKAPPGCTEVPSKAHCLARSLAVKWFETKSRVLWRLASPNGTFNWDVLFDKAGRQGEDRIDGQVVKANVDPSACCSGSPAGSTQWRLRADNSGFGHLFLAGAWIDTGFNVECIEAAVMSGKQAARAITGSESTIVGEDFLHFERGLGALVAELFREVETLVEGEFRFAFGGAEGELARRASRTRRQNRGRSQ